MEVSSLSNSPPASNAGAVSSVKVDPPRSQPISVAAKKDCVNEDVLSPRPDHINSLSPPSIQFCVGTPPGMITGRRRSTSGSSCGGSSPPYGAGSPWPLVNSPLRRGGSHFPIFGETGSLASIKGSPTKGVNVLGYVSENEASENVSIPASVTSAIPERRNSEWNRLSPAAGAHPTRAMTLPEFSSPPSGARSGNQSGFQRSQTDVIMSGSPSATGMGSRSPSHFIAGLQNSHGSGSNWSLLRKPSVEQHMGVLGFGTSPPQVEGPIVFIAPQLTQDTLFEKEHNDTLAKLNFVLALVECIMEVARTRASPLAAALSESIHYRSGTKMATSPSGDGPCSPALSDIQRKAEQLVLNIRALQLLSSALSLSREELQAERLHSSTSVKQVVRMLYERFDHCLSQCKKLNGQSLACQLGDSAAAQLTADKLLYNHAIELCQSAALDELFGNPASCCRRYQTAHILFHSLAQQVTQLADRNILNKYREAVEKRLFVLQQQGYIHAYDTT